MVTPQACCNEYTKLDVLIVGVVKRGSHHPGSVPAYACRLETSGAPRPSPGDWRRAVLNQIDLGGAWDAAPSATMVGLLHGIQFPL
jgi:hypothetical protein